jgi:hypothetical protein
MLISPPSKLSGECSVRSTGYISTTPLDCVVAGLASVPALCLDLAFLWSVVRLGYGTSRMVQESLSRKRLGGRVGTLGRKGIYSTQWFLIMWSQQLVTTSAQLMVCLIGHGLTAGRAGRLVGSREADLG